MGTFRPDEMVSVQGKEFPTVGGRLRVAHERHDAKLSIETSLTNNNPEHPIVAARVTTSQGTFTAHSCADSKADSKLGDSLLELAETRAIARALRFAGIGVEYTGVEELGRNNGFQSGAPKPAPRPVERAPDPPEPGPNFDRRPEPHKARRVAIADQLVAMTGSTKQDASKAREMMGQILPGKTATAQLSEHECDLMDAAILLLKQCGGSVDSAKRMMKDVMQLPWFDRMQAADLAVLRDQLTNERTPNPTNINVNPQQGEVPF